MSAFDFTNACMIITTHLVESRNAEAATETWRLSFPRMIAEEVDKAEEIFPTLGLRSPAAVQQSICRRFWTRLYKNHPIPWAEDPDSHGITFGQGEEMEMSVLNTALTVSCTDIKGSLKILATNSIEGVKIDSKELAQTIRGGTTDVEIKTVASQGASPAQVNPEPGHPAQATPALIFTTGAPHFSAGFRPRDVSQISRDTRPAQRPTARLGPSSIVESSSAAEKRQTSVATTLPSAWRNWAPPEVPGSSHTVSRPRPGNKREGEIVETRIKGFEDDQQLGSLIKELQALHAHRWADEMDEKYPLLPRGDKVNLGSRPALRFLPGTTPPPSAESRLTCSFGSWEHENGKPLPCLPGVGPGEIPLPDNLDPTEYLLPIKTELECWLNVDLWFQRKGKESSHNKIRIMPSKWRGRARLAEVDEMYGFLAFEVLCEWVKKMAKDRKMIPVMDVILQQFQGHDNSRIHRDHTFQNVQPWVGSSLYKGPIKPISRDEMMKGIKRHSSKPTAEGSLVPKDGQVPTNLNVQKGIATVKDPKGKGVDRGPKDKGIQPKPTSTPRASKNDSMR
ncbi:hypothetical protein F5B18DRAFT_520126 [Nemania serpens]|nr:hypothetical protein F5B18DRAFT_520126 [Nemania serpens]